MEAPKGNPITVQIFTSEERLLSSSAASETNLQQTMPSSPTSDSHKQMQSCMYRLHDKACGYRFPLQLPIALVYA